MAKEALSTGIRWKREEFYRNTERCTNMHRRQKSPIIPGLILLQSGHYFWKCQKK